MSLKFKDPVNFLFLFKSIIGIYVKYGVSTNDLIRVFKFNNQDAL